MSTENNTPIYWAVVEGRDYKPRDRFPYDPCAETRMAWLEATEYIELLEQRIEKAYARITELTRHLAIEELVQMDFGGE